MIVPLLKKILVQPGAVGSAVVALTQVAGIAAAAAGQVLPVVLIKNDY